MSATQKTLTPSSSAARSRLRVAPRAIILLVGVVLLGMALAYPVRLLIDQREQVASLTRQTEALRIENELLVGQVRKLRDPAYLEQMARACLGMVRKGETAFVIIPKDGGTAETVPCEIAMDDPVAAPGT